MSNTNADVANMWRKGKKAKSSNGNLSCVSHTLYSYNTPIAHIRDGVALITCEGFSVTTEGKHKNAARHAVKYDYFSVPYLLLEPGSYSGRGVSYVGASIEAQHAANVTYLQKEIEAEEARLKRARTYTNPELKRKTLADYKAAFGLA